MTSDGSTPTLKRTLRPDGRPPATEPAAFARGKSYPLGARLVPGGANFSLYAKRASQVQLLLFDGVDDPRPARTIELLPGRNRSYHYWHAFVPGVRHGQVYAYRVHGPVDPARGLRFDPEKLLLDPYGQAVVRPRGRSRASAGLPGDNAATAPRNVVVDLKLYDWEGDEPPRHPYSRSVIYELHVGAFTRHPNSGLPAARRGTYAGLIDKLPYLKELGVTAIELLPVFAFDEQDAPAGRINDWGYAPLAFFAPHEAYSSQGGPMGPLDEFRDLVKASHRAGLEVLLDVDFNHTAEGNENGPTLCFRGLSNPDYYILEADQSRYANYTGCGNTLNANHPVVRRLILDSLRHWVREFHVDGFRFDLASVLARDEQGRPMVSPPILWDIESDPVLSEVKLIAEAWDAGGLYQVGSFIGDSWKEWNGKFRDDVRGFLKGDDGLAHALALRLTGSPDLYGHENREAEQSINFVTCHDGFTLNDVVSYNGKHNEDNGEDNRDGADDNRSWNCGVEGPTDDPQVEALRNRQVKNFLALTLLSIGTPMLLMGDEVRRTQRGNNNAFCQNSELSWFDWDRLRAHADVHRFVAQLIALRRRRELDAERDGLSLNELLRRQPVAWHGTRLDQPDWGGASHTIAATLMPSGGDLLLHVIINSYWEALDFELPPPQPGRTPWRRCVDTALASPEDVRGWAEAPPVETASYRAEPRSVVVLVSRRSAPATRRARSTRGL